MRPMGNVTVDKVSVVSHIDTADVLKSILDVEDINVTFVSGGGNGATVDLTLHPTHYDDELRRIFLDNEAIQARFERLGIELVDTR